MSALLPKLLPSTKKRQTRITDLASGPGGATGTRTPDPLLAKTFAPLDTQGHSPRLQRPNALCAQVCWSVGVTRRLLAAPEIAPGGAA